MSDNIGMSTDNWSASLDLNKTLVEYGDFVAATAIVKGANPHACTYRFTWMLEGGGEGGTSGEPNGEFQYGFAPPHEGKFLITCDITGPDGQTVTASRWMTCGDTDEFTRPPLPSPDAETVVSVDDVSMVFNIASEQFNSLKEYFIALMRHELKFKEFRALDHISFEVKRGEAFGLVGTNGSGKSTMLKIIAGVLDASSGSCRVAGTIAPLIELGAGFDMELTAKENIYLNGALLGYRKEFIDEHFQDIVEFAELQNFMEMPLKNYSSGMVARIAFAIATITEPDILIVDETLSVGDFLFQKKCERRIKELVSADNVTVLLVSHSIDLVERICDRVCWIEKGKQRMLGPTDEVCEAYKNLGK